MLIHLALPIHVYETYIQQWGSAFNQISVSKLGMCQKWSRSKILDEFGKKKKKTPLLICYHCGLADGANS